MTPRVPPEPHSQCSLRLQASRRGQLGTRALGTRIGTPRRQLASDDRASGPKLVRALVHPVLPRDAAGVATAMAGATAAAFLAATAVARTPLAALGEARTALAATARFAGSLGPHINPQLLLGPRSMALAQGPFTLSFTLFG